MARFHETVIHQVRFKSALEDEIKFVVTFCILELVHSVLRIVLVLIFLKSPNTLVGLKV